jgi:hypothetical protein
MCYHPTDLNFLGLFTQVIFVEQCNLLCCLFPWISSHLRVLTTITVFLQVRELDCIPVLLDCCNIDARNPRILYSLHLLYNCFKVFILYCFFGMTAETWAKYVGGWHMCCCDTPYNTDPTLCHGQRLQMVLGCLTTFLLHRSHITPQTEVTNGFRSFV